MNDLHRGTNFKKPSYWDCSPWTFTSDRGDDGYAAPFTIYVYNPGVGVMEDCAVTAVLSKDDKVSGVETTHGNIECEYFINCAGFWARKVRQRYCTTLGQITRVKHFFCRSWALGLKILNLYSSVFFST